MYTNVCIGSSILFMYKFSTYPYKYRMETREAMREKHLHMDGTQITNEWEKFWKGHTHTNTNTHTQTNTYIQTNTIVHGQGERDKDQYDNNILTGMGVGKGECDIASQVKMKMDVGFSLPYKSCYNIVAFDYCVSIK